MSGRKRKVIKSQKNSKQRTILWRRGADEYNITDITCRESITMILYTHLPIIAICVMVICSNNFHPAYLSPIIYYLKAYLSPIIYYLKDMFK